MATCHPLYLAVIISALVFQIVTMCTQIWAMSNYDITKEWYSGTTSAYFSIAYGPPKWLVLLIWTLIYGYQLLWSMYVLSTLWRRVPYGDEHLYYEPQFLPLSMYSALLVNLIFRLAWSAMLRDCNALCPLLQLGAALAITIAFVIAIRALVSEAGALYRLGLYRDVTVVRALVHNGFAGYATWELIDLSVCVSGLMARDGYAQKEAFATMLGVLGLVLVVYVIADVTRLDVYLRYTVTPYVVAALYFISILAEHADDDVIVVTALSAILLVGSLLALALKVAVILYRKQYQPEPIPLTEPTPGRKLARGGIATRVNTRMPRRIVDTVTAVYM